MSIVERVITKLLAEAARSANDLPDDTIILVQSDEIGGVVEYSAAPGFQQASVNGYLEWRTIPNKPNEVVMSNSDTGWGPLLYDLAIELSGPLGLTSDRWIVSSSARNIWNYYRDKRPDVKKVQYDNKDNELTPEDEDNLEQDSAYFDPTTKPWHQSALSKAYVSNGTPTVDALKRSGKIEFKRWVDPAKGN